MTEKVEWNLATVFFDVKAMLKICKNLKKYRNIQKRISNARISTRPLNFREPTYRSKIIDVLSCEIAHTKHLPSGTEYFNVTRGKKDKTYYLLIEVQSDREETYFLDEFVTLEGEVDEEDKILSIWTTEL